MTTAAQVGPSPSGGGPAPSGHPVHAYLTARQRQVLVLAANGHTNRSIGRQLGIDEETVKSLMRTILRRLHADDRAQAVGVGLRLEVLDLADIAIPPAMAHHHLEPA